MQPHPVAFSGEGFSFILFFSVLLVWDEGRAGGGSLGGTNGPHALCGGRSQQLCGARVFQLFTGDHLGFSSGGSSSLLKILGVGFLIRESLGASVLDSVVRLRL